MRPEVFIRKINKDPQAGVLSETSEPDLTKKEQLIRLELGKSPLKSSIDRRDPRLRIRRGRGGSCRRMPHSEGKCPMERSNCRVVGSKFTQSLQRNSGKKGDRDLRVLSSVPSQKTGEVRRKTNSSHQQEAA
jgi:hypothetical protein